MTPLIVLMIALQAADGLTTWRGLQLPGVSEANGLLAKPMARFGVAPVLIVYKLIAVALGVITALNIEAMGQFGPPALFLFVALHGWAFVRNLHAIRKAEQ